MSIVSQLSRKIRRSTTRRAGQTTIAVDYPQEGETINSTGYTFRISAGPELTQVEVAIDGGSWQGCRNESGFWWLDWSCTDSASHTLLARGLSETGKHVLSNQRQFVCQRRFQ